MASNAPAGMTAEQLRDALDRIADRLGSDDGNVPLIRDKLTAEIRALAARLSGMAAVPTEGRIYVVNRIGMATLCKGEADARREASDADAQWPQNGPHIVAWLTAVPTWQPIECIPTDGTWVLIWRRDYVRPSMGRWYEPWNRWVIDGWDGHPWDMAGARWFRPPAAPEVPGHG